MWWSQVENTTELTAEQTWKKGEGNGMQSCWLYTRGTRRMMVPSEGTRNSAEQEKNWWVQFGPSWVWDAGRMSSRQLQSNMLLGWEVRHEMLIYRKLTHQNEVWRQEADAATPKQGDLKEMFFRTYKHWEVKENRSDVNNNGGVPKWS